MRYLGLINHMHRGGHDNPQTIVRKEAPVIVIAMRYFLFESRVCLQKHSSVSCSGVNEANAITRNTRKSHERRLSRFGTAVLEVPELELYD